jgi:hypothetical protein
VNSLYFVEVKADGNSFYKIGITTRLIEEPRFDGDRTWVCERFQVNEIRMLHSP